MSLPTRQLFKLHRYAGLVTAPMILFFALSGIFQVFRLQEDHKPGYKAPAILKGASDFHKAEGLEGPRAMGFKIAISLAAVVLSFAACLGIILGYRTMRPRWMATLLLTIGIVLPILLYWIAMKPGGN